MFPWHGKILEVPTYAPEAIIICNILFLWERNKMDGSEHSHRCCQKGKQAHRRGGSSFYASFLQSILKRKLVAQLYQDQSSAVTSECDRSVTSGLIRSRNRITPLMGMVGSARSK